MSPDADPVAKKTRRAAFAALAAKRLEGVPAAEAREEVAEEFVLTPEQVAAIEQEGSDRRWPPLGSTRRIRLGWVVLLGFMATCVGSVVGLFNTPDKRDLWSDVFFVGVCAGWVGAGATAAVMLTWSVPESSLGGWAKHVLGVIAVYGLLPVMYVLLFVVCGGGFN